MTRVVIAALAVSYALAASSASAQVQEPPPRSFRGVFGGGRPPDATRSRQELTLNLNVLGGAEDNLMPPGGGTNSQFQENGRGYSGVGDAALRYWLGKDTRSLAVTGRGYMHTYRNAGIGRVFGDALAVNGTTSLGQRNQLTASSAMESSPYFAVGVFGSVPLDEAGTSHPEAGNSGHGVAGERTRNLSSDVGFTRNWTRNFHTDVGYLYSMIRYPEGTAADGTMNTASVGGSYAFGRALSLRASARRGHSVYDQLDGTERPNTDSSVEVGLQHQRNLSRTRQISFSGSVGMTYVDTIEPTTAQPTKYHTPSGQFTTRIDIGRSWNVSGDYRRAVTMLQGLRPQSFITHTVLVRSGGFIGTRFEAVATAGYSNGVTGASVDGNYDAYSTTGQLRVRLSRSWSAIVMADHYEYKLSEAARVMLGSAPMVDRNTVRVGFTCSLPLFGSYMEPARRGVN